MKPKTTKINPIGINGFAFAVTLFAASLQFASVSYAQETLGTSASLIATLESSESSLYEKAKACQQLAVVGDSSAVKSLSKLLSHPQLGVYACTGLGRIPGDEAKDAIIEGIESTKDRSLIGLMSLAGQSGITSAADSIANRINSGDLNELELQGAITALGRIGNDAAKKTLKSIDTEKVSPLTRRLLDDAYKFAGIAETKVPTSDALISALLDDDKHTFRRALQEARSSGNIGASAIATAIPRLAPNRQAAALIALPSFESPLGADVAKELIRSDNAEVAARAFDTVAQLNAFPRDSIPAIVMERPELADRFMSSLAANGSKGVDAAVVAKLSDASLPSAVRIGLANYVADRRVDAATETLLVLSKSDDPALQAAAMEAAGMTVNADQWGMLLERLLNSSSDTQVISAAMERALVHLPQDSAATVLGDAIGTAEGDKKMLLVSKLAFVGGAEALETAVALANSGDDSNLDAATRVLGQWTTADVAEPLLQLADKLPKGKYQLRALRGYLRVGRQLEMPIQERADLCREGWQRSDRDDERKLILEIMKRFPSKANLMWMIERLDSDQVKSDRQLTNRMMITLDQVAQRVAKDDAKFVKEQLAALDMDKAPTAVRESLEALAK